MHREKKHDMIGKLAIQGGGRVRCVVSRWRGGRACRLGVVGETGGLSVRIGDGKNVRISTIFELVHQQNAMTNVPNVGFTLQCCKSFRYRR